MSPKLKQTLTSGLLALFLAYSPVACKDYSIKSISTQKQEQTTSKTEQLGFEEKLYQRKLGLRREISLKEIKLCRSITPENQCQEIDFLQRNQTFYILADFDLLGLKDTPLTKEIRLNYQGKETSLSSETESFPQEKDLTAKASAFIDEEKSPGDYTLEFILKDPASDSSASLTRKIEIKEGLIINDLKLCEKVRNRQCIAENSTFSEEKGRLYFLLNTTAHQENLEQLVLTGNYRLSDSSGNIVKKGKLKYSKRTPGETEEVILSRKIPFKGSYPLGEYTLKIELENPELNLAAQRESKFTLTGLRIKDFRFCEEKDFADGECKRDSIKFMKKINQPLSVHFSYYVESNIDSSTNIQTEEILKYNGEILEEFKKIKSLEGMNHEGSHSKTILMNGKINLYIDYKEVSDKPVLEITIKNPKINKEKKFEKSFVLVSETQLAHEVIEFNGLIWQKKPFVKTVYRFPPEPKIPEELIHLKAKIGKGLLFSEAKRYCAALILGGQSNWRLPTKRELQSLAGNTRRGFSCYINPPFGAGRDECESRYWSSSQSDSKRAWVVDYCLSIGGTVNVDNIHHRANVRCVAEPEL